MSLFLVLIVVGLVGLGLMALPGFLPHGHAAGAPHGLNAGHSHGGLHIGHHGAHGTQGAHGAHGTHTGAEGHGAHHSADETVSATRWIPSPRTIFSLMTLFGAFGYMLAEAAHLTPMLAGLIALVPTLLMERFVVGPLWNLLFRFQGEPAKPLTELVMSEAEAVTPFSNGRGIVRVVHDGRTVQFCAYLPQEQAGIPVRVGDKLQVEEVDLAKERLTVTLK